MSVQHHSLDVLHVGVVLECSTVEANLLTHFGYLLSVVSGEEIQLEDALGNIWCAYDVDLEDLGLEVALIWPIVLEGFKKESSAFLDFVELEENMCDLVNIGFWWSLVSVGDHFGQSNCSLSIDWHDLPENLYEIGDMASLLAVRHDLVKLISLNKPLNDLLR